MKARCFVGPPRQPTRPVGRNGVAGPRPEGIHERPWLQVLVLRGFLGACERAGPGGPSPSSSAARRLGRGRHHCRTLHGACTRPAAEGIATMAQTLRAYCSRAGRMVANTTGDHSGRTATHEDMWRFTPAGYSAGPGCLADALSQAWRSGRALAWESVSAPAFHFMHRRSRLRRAH
jgi:hypothetical protein